MSPEVFRGPDLKAVLEAVRRAFGEDAMIVKTRGPSEIGFGYEVTVQPMVTPARHPHLAPARADRPTVIALIGSAGAGKSTAAAKLALHFAAQQSRVALLTLDDYKVGALEQMQLFAELVDTPLDYLHAAEELSAVRARMAQYDVVIVDTPGRRSGTGDSAWAPLLAALSPDQVHLVVNAALRDDVLQRTQAAYAALAPDHLLVAHIDTLPQGCDPLHAANLLRLPVRWVADSPELRAPLRTPAPARTTAPQRAEAEESLTLWQAHAIAGARLGARA